jgi:hypothetical protein
MNEDKEVYLGDGLYVSWDGHCIWLRALRTSGDHVVGLEPEVLDRLLAFVSDVRAQHEGDVSLER